MQIPQHLVPVIEEQLGRFSNEWLFPAGEGGVVRRSHFLRRVWATATRRAGLTGVTPHSLRHSHASWSIAQGMNVLALSRRLGHAKPSITLDTYSHLWPGGDGEIADALDRLHAATADESTTDATSIRAL